ncbi:hypothetical protein ACFL3Q_16040 [Planctomycetota bacterium]
MKTRMIISVFLGAVTLVTAAQAKYSVTILHPTFSFDGTSAWGVSGGQQVGKGYGIVTGGDYHALLWSGSASTVKDLHPAGFDSSWADGVSGGQQVGAGEITVGDVLEDHALLWSGTAESVVDLHPVAHPHFFDYTYAYDISGGQQVGEGYGSATGGEWHALLWSGTAESIVDLHPAVGFDETVANGISGGQQVGYGGISFGETTEWHALLWSGSASTVKDLHPAGFDWSRAYDISGGQQVGYGGISFGETTEWHALLWSGTATSVKDLHPAGFQRSYAYGISGSRQVGCGSGNVTGGNRHALVWSGNASSVIDLHKYVPSVYQESEALGVDSAGNIVGRVHKQPYPASSYAVMWIPSNPPVAIASAIDETVHSKIWILPGYDPEAIGEATLDGSDSYDPDGNELTYAWYLEGEMIAEGVSPTIELPVGEHTITLVVNDGTEDSEPDEVIITVIEPIESELWIFPPVIQRDRGYGEIVVLLRLPEGIRRDQVDMDQPLEIYPIYPIGGIEATHQYAIQWRKRRTVRTSILAFFDKSELMDIIVDDDQVELPVVGQLYSGQYFYGTDTVSINDSLLDAEDWMDIESSPLSDKAIDEDIPTIEGKGVTVDIYSPLEELIAAVEGMDLPKGTANGLLSILRAANRIMIEQGLEAMAEYLKAFVDQCEKIRGTKLTEDQTDYLIEEATKLLD